MAPLKKTKKQRKKQQQPSTYWLPSCLRACVRVCPCVVFFFLTSCSGACVWAESRRDTRASLPIAVPRTCRRRSSQSPARRGAAQRGRRRKGKNHHLLPRRGVLPPHAASSSSLAPSEKHVPSTGTLLFQTPRIRVTPNLHKTSTQKQRPDGGVCIRVFTS